jgi:hypothetical protein
MQPVLDGLALGNFEEHQVRNDAILRAPRWRLENDLVFVLERMAPAKRGLPKGGDPGWVGGVNAQALDAYTHVPTMTGWQCRVQWFCRRRSPTAKVVWCAPDAELPEPGALRPCR